jgi:hypothetical protein
LTSECFGVCSQSLAETETESKGHKLGRGVEQLVARRAHNPKVVGSSPAPATKKIMSRRLGAGFPVGG